MAADRCDWPRCASPSVIGWLGKPLCDRHWRRVCELTGSPEGREEAYGTLRVPKRLRSARKGSEQAGGEFGDLPDPDGFDYTV